MNRIALYFVVALLGLGLVDAHADVWSRTDAVVRAQHGEDGLRAWKFLSKHQTNDAEIDAAIIDETLTYALRARKEFPWDQQLSEEMFFSNVLPYAALNETRELWREKFYNICKPMVSGCKTSSEAAHVINQALFDAVNVHYHTGRKRANQSPSESIAQGKATCTGLSILLVNACRSVGIPARIAGVANWKEIDGNHTWVEIWDEDGWHFMGADEPDDRGLDHAWFEKLVAQAIPGDPKYAVWATSFKRTDHHFPMVWNPDDKSVYAVDVTERYLKSDEAKKIRTWSFRLWDREDGQRLWASGLVINKGGEIVGRFSTRAGTCDLNDMPQVELNRNGPFQLYLMHDGRIKQTTLKIRDRTSATVELYWNECDPALLDDGSFAPLSKVAAEGLLEESLPRFFKDFAQMTDQSDLRRKCFSIGDKDLKFEDRVFGPEPADGRSLWISLHGGGNAPTTVNDRQWENQIKLYEPEEGIYVAPRAPTDTWNLWHQAHIDKLLDQLIQRLVLLRNVNPNKVYLLGYSAGGDGVYQLAPRMADRFAAAAMMAGHPNEAQPLGLRNLPFAIFMGGDDAAYDRNTVARQWGEKLAALQKEDPQGYPHRVTIYPGLGHWMDGRDQEALPWMAAQTRNPWPQRVVWYQDDVTHTRFYWLEVEKDDAQQGTTIRAAVDGQTIALTSDKVSKVTLHLRDALIDLQKPITVTANGKVVYKGHVARTAGAILRSFHQRGDVPAAATALLTVDW